MTRVCCKCKVEKPFELFHKDSQKKHGIRYSCKECEKIRMRKYDSSEAGKARARRGHWTKQKINISNEEYEIKFKEQNGECLICKQKFTTLCVDHDHETQEIRGLLCKACNLGIGNLKDDLQLLQNAIEYLKGYSND